jgi:AGZA family xanthine/uracil permease-like MFS transporter
MILGIAGTTVLALATGQTAWRPAQAGIDDLRQTVFQLDFHSLMRLGILDVIFTFTFVDLFDNLGTLVAVSRRAGLLTETHNIPRVGKILAVDACATIGGALLGTSTVTSYVESAAGIAAGGRTGVTAVVTGLLFLFSTFALPLVGIIPASATAPVLVLVGMLMMAHAAEVRWAEPDEAIPAFLTMIGIPLTFSIANGLSFGLIACALFRIARGEIRKPEWLLYVLAGLSLARFIYIKQL